MAFTTPNLGLKVWNSLNDPYDHEQLAGNMLRIDKHDHGAEGGEQISTAGLADSSVTSAKIAPGGLSGSLLAPGSIAEANLATGAVTESKLANGSVTEPKMADSAVSTRVIQDAAVTAAKMAQAMHDIITPPGTMTMYAGASAPTGWLFCDNTQYLVSTYPVLGALMGPIWGYTDGSGGVGVTHFRVPDMRDAVAVGKSGTIDLADAGGSNSAALPVHDHTTNNHSHSITDPGHQIALHYYLGGAVNGAPTLTHPGGDAWGLYSWNLGEDIAFGAVGPQYAGSGSINIYADAPIAEPQSTGITGTNNGSVTVNPNGAVVGPDNNMQKHVGLNYIICTGKIV